MAEPLSIQDYCSLVPYQAGGALVAGRTQGCSVVLQDGDLILITDQGEVDRRQTRARPGAGQAEDGLLAIRRSAGPADYAFP